MLTRILIVICVCLGSTPALAQGSSSSSSSSSRGAPRSEARFEASGGYSYSNGDINHSLGSNSLPKGWNGGFVYFLTEEAGIDVDIGGHYGPQYFGEPAGTVPSSLYTYLAGVKAKHALGKVEVSGRLLGGFAHSTGVPGGLQETTSIAILFGGALDIPLGGFGIRAIQVDFLVSGAVKSFTPIVTAGAYYRW